jgi:hypothetical protein
VKRSKDSSFCEQKEAKKLCPLGPAPTTERLQSPKSFLVLFFKKEHASFLPEDCTYDD